MFRRIAHFFQLGKKDEALEKRFAKIKEKYLEASAGQITASDPIGHMRITGNFDKRTVTGAATMTREKITEDLLKSCARAVGPDSE